MILALDMYVNAIQFLSDFVRDSFKTTYTVYYSIYSYNMCIYGTINYYNELLCFLKP